MKFEKININNPRKRVLVAPLDWGLGHATRCIPIIYSLLAQNFEVIIAAEGAAKILLKTEFPDVVFTHLKGYNIRYSSKGSLLPLRLLMQFPGLMRSVFSEHLWLKKIIQEYNINLVISDNRLGLFHKKIPCIYITHQLQIKTGNRFTERLAQKIHYFFINKYNSCWVPDNKENNNLAGALSHPKKLPATIVKYIGPLSRFEKTATPKKYDLLVLISGPEPQRQIFETLLLDQLRTFSGKTLLVRGLPGNEATGSFFNSADNITIVNHLAAADLNIALLQSEMVICRSGYTSVMDLVKLQRKAILVPTPGQTEQEYLAAYLMQQQLFCSVTQKDFSLPLALKNAAAFPFKNFAGDTADHNEIVAAITALFT